MFATDTMLATAHCHVCPDAYRFAVDEANIAYYETGAYQEFPDDIEFEEDSVERFFLEELLYAGRMYSGNTRLDSVVLSAPDPVFVAPEPPRIR